MRKSFYLLVLVLFCGSLAAQTKNSRGQNASKTVLEGRPANIRLVPQMTTTIRLPEPISSVVIGDTNLFQAEYSPSEPLSVFVRPSASSNAPTNLVISTVNGRQFVLLLNNIGMSGTESEPAVDLLVTCQAAGLRFIEDTFPWALISETVHLSDAPERPSPKTSISGDSPKAYNPGTW